MEFNNGLKFAHNAVNSVTAEDVGKYFRTAPDRREFWDLSVNMYLYGERYFGQEEISIFDGGCGAGQLTYLATEEAFLRGFNVHTTFADMLPRNIHKTKETLAPLENLRPKKVEIYPFLGDLTKKFPDRMFDLVIFNELIHWMSLSQVEQLFARTSEHMNSGARLMVTYATPLNNASLQGKDGNLDYGRRGRAPLQRFSYSTQVDMTFFDRPSITKIAQSEGLELIAFEQLTNLTFPTDKHLFYGFYRGFTSTENEGVLFEKRSV